MIKVFIKRSGIDLGTPDGGKTKKYRELVRAMLDTSFLHTGEEGSSKEKHLKPVSGKFKSQRRDKNSGFGFWKG